MKKQKILITGCGGMLGEAIFSTFSGNNNQVLATDIDLNEEWLCKLDVRNMKECEDVFKSFNPDIVLHLAALTDLEYCERNPEQTWITNALGTENMALLAQKYNALMVYIGTAGIFDGKQKHYSEFDRPNPLSVYSKSKYYGEVFIQQNCSNFFIFRAGWLMGGGLQKDKKFIGKIYKQIKSGKRELFIVNDKIGSPTYTNNFAESMLKVIKSGYYGTYNQVCEGECSWLDIAKEFVELLGLTDTVKITAVTSDFYKNEYYAPRPPSERLINLKLNARNMNYMRHWKECLKEYSQIYIRDLHQNKKG